jgi:hypothetical protein
MEFVVLDLDEDTCTREDVDRALKRARFLYHPDRTTTAVETTLATRLWHLHEEAHRRVVQRLRLRDAVRPLMNSK